MVQTRHIFAALDYRAYLKQRMAELKQQDGVSLRDFAKAAGIKAPGYLKMVVEGRRSLTPATAGKFARALGLKGKEREYFTTLVVYNQTHDPDLKKLHFDRLIQLRPRSAEFMRDKREDRYFSRHHYVCIREMVALPDFIEDTQWIAARCYPPISPTQAKQAIETLLKLELLKRDANGRLVEGESLHNERDRNSQSAAAYHFHEGALDRARHALGQLAQEERSFHALTIPMPKTMLPEIVDEYYAFRDKIVNKLSEKGVRFDEVYQMNFQVFPVTRGKQP